ncbi:flavodoxin-dependent (E)-4-hydroxy-3-methylbut-2-enyl-diphosphate synthase [Candidatus Omnitrophota bacterium]
MIKRRKAYKVRIANTAIGGGAPVLIQSMATKKTSQVTSVAKQINELAAMGCEMVRVSILNEKDARAIEKIKPLISIPICADIHFHYQFALAAMAAGVDKIRINPGNIGGRENIIKVFRAAKKHKVAVRVGVNSGSLPPMSSRPKRRDLDPHFRRDDKRIRHMVQSLKRVIRIAETEKFKNLVLSIKSSDPVETIEANRLLAQETKYPIHLGVTATGAGIDAIIKSTVALSTLLAEGIGDTIRVSLTADPREEVIVATKILQALGLRDYPYQIIACPTCGRTEIGIQKLVRDVERRIQNECDITQLHYKSIAIMGCVVNGPGEAKEADIGIAGGKGFGFIFKKGKKIKKVPEHKLVDELMKELKT